MKYHVSPRPGELDKLGANRYEVFHNGLASVVSIAAWELTPYITQQKVPFALAPVPRGKRSVPDVTLSTFGIIAGTKYPEESWQVIKFLLEGARWAIYVDSIPSQAAMQVPFLQNAFKNFPNVDITAITNGLAVAVPQVRLFRVPAFGQLDAEINKQFNERVLTGKADVATVLKELKPVLQAIVDRS
jgi:ABC-type glycerol-3-phosphate transport system substrate-binding protein